MATFDVVIGQRHVKRILARNEINRDVIAPTGRIRVIVSAVAAAPILVPRTLVVRDRVIARGPFADPENCGYDIRFPGVSSPTDCEAVAAAHQ